MDVVLVHGIWDGGRVFQKMANALEAAGHRCFRPDLEPANGSLGLADLARKLKAYIDRRLGPDGRFALIGHSMGGIVTRYYLQKLDGAARVTRYFTISGPHHGTLAAHIWPGKAARDMRFGSGLLDELNADTSALLPLMSQSYRTPFDLMIVPSTTSHVD
ncbi:MAG: esterase/lipase family protein [Verrucomicrobiota bacterium]